MKVKRKKFKEQLKQFIGDDKDLLSKIESGQLQYDNLEEIVHTYNLQ